MERITGKCWRNLDPWECCGQDHHCSRNYHMEGGCANGCIVPRIYAKLGRYEDAEEAGRLVMLPCNVGDTIYIPSPIMGDRTYRSVVDGFRYFGNSWWIAAGGRYYRFREVGKRVFLCKESSEQALKEGNK